MDYKQKQKTKRLPEGFWTKKTIAITIIILLLFILVLMEVNETKKGRLMNELCLDKGYDQFIKMEETTAGTIVQCQKTINEIFKFKEEGECRCLI